MNLKFQNFLIGTRFGMALALPIMGLVGFSLWILAGYFHAANDVGNIRRMAAVAPMAGNLIHAIQKERGISVGVISSDAVAFAESLPAVYLETDNRHVEFDQALSRLNTARLSEKISGNLIGKIATAVELTDQIVIWRGAVLKRTTAATDMNRHYSAAIEKLIDVIEEMLLVSNDTNLTREIYSYIHFVRAKEYVGQERALGTEWFAAGRRDPASGERLISLIDRQRANLREFKNFAPAEHVALVEQTISSQEDPEVERMRRIIINKGNVSSRSVDAGHWSEILSRRIDALKRIEDRIASDLIARSMEAETSAWRSVKWVSVLTVIILTLTIAFAAAIVRGIIHPLIRITLAMNRLAAREEVVGIENLDGGRRDEIGDMTRAILVFNDNVAQTVLAEERLKSEILLRRHHQELSASETRYRAAVQSANDAIITVDSTGNVVSWNLRAEVIFGYTEAEISGRPLTLLIPYRYRELHLAGMRRVLSSGEQHVIGKTVEVEGLRKDQSEFPIELSLAMWDVAEGRFITGTIRDITERKHAEQRQRIAAIAFESQQGMMVTNDKSVILQVNRAFTQITGYSAEEVVGQTPRLLNSGRQDETFYAEMWGSIKRDGVWQGELWNRNKSGEIYPEWLSITAVLDEQGQAINYVASFSDITLRKQAEDKIQHLAFYDSLTGLPNRRLLVDRLQRALAAHARSERQCALLFIDLDSFKILNDTHGHDKGDQLLEQVARRLVTCVRDSDTVARLGGDEFVVMLEDLDGSMAEAATQAQSVGEKILGTLNRIYNLDGMEYHSTPSIGITLFGKQREGADELLKRADLAMYQAKASGRNTLCFFDPAMQAAVIARAALEEDLREAVQRYAFPLEQYQFLLFYQPQVDGAGCLTGAEALVRWRHPQRGMVPPLQFIPLAEETGLILPLGHWVVETACLQLVAWAKQPETEHLTLAVNVSARQFHHRYFVDLVVAALDYTGANPQRLKLELTESLLVDDVENIIEKMIALKARGVGFSLDDFGTGYSSLSYLKRLPLDQLKIDQSFVRDVLTDPNDAAIARTVIALGQSLGLAVIAEGVEKEGQRDFLASHGCHAYQGYLFGRPVTAEEFPQFIEKFGRLQA